MDKAVQLSDPCFLDENIAIIKNTLLNNQYPSSFIDTDVKKVLNVSKQPIVENTDDSVFSEKTYRVSTPFVNQIATKIKRV